MRVAIYNEYINTMGGGERLCLDIGQALASRRDISTVHITSCSRRVPSKKDIKSRFGLVIDHKLSLVSFWPGLCSWAKFILKIPILANITRFFYYRKFMQQYDIIINHTANSWFYLPKHPQQIYLMMFPFSGVRGSIFRRMLERAGQKFSLKYYREIWAISNFTSRITQGLYQIPIPHRIIYPSFGTSVRRTKTFKKQKSIRILSLARFSNSGHAKRQDQLLYAFHLLQSELPGAKLTLCGGYSDKDENERKYVRQLQEFVSQHHLNVEFRFNITNVEKDKLFAAHDVFWLGTGFSANGEKPASDFECEHFGIVVPEAMSGGLVPFTYNRGGVIETYEDGISGFACASPDELAEKTLAFHYLSPEKKSRISAACAKKSGYFELTSFNKRLNQIFRTT